MDKLFERHDEYLSTTPMNYVRCFSEQIDWSLQLVIIKGPKGVGKSTLMQQYIKLHFSPDDRHVLYCSADSSYFANHTLLDTAERFYRIGGRHLFIDEVHKYENWSREVKEIYDLHKDLHLVLSGSSLLQINDGQTDLSRRKVEYVMPGLSMREFLYMDCGIEIEPISLEELLEAPNAYCNEVKKRCHPLEHFKRYLKYGYYPFYFESRNAYQSRLESVVNYIIDSELTQFRGLEVGNVRKIKALLKVLSQMVPYEVDIAKLSKNIGIQRTTSLKYLYYLEEAALIRRLFTNIDSVGDLQKPDKILLDNSNLLYTISDREPEIGTVRETFFCNQLASTGHRVEYGGLKTGDFRVDGEMVVEVGGRDKGFGQIKDEERAYVAADDIDSATNIAGMLLPSGREAKRCKVPLWAFGFLY